MIIKIIYKKTNSNEYKKMTKILLQQKIKLNFLFDSLMTSGNDFYIMQNEKYVVIGSIFYDENNNHNNDDTSRLILLRSNYDDIVYQWNNNLHNLKNYLIFIQDEHGLITIEAKDELSAQDLQAIEEDHQAAQAWQESWHKQQNDFWINKKWRNLKYNISRIWLRFRQWLQV